MNWRFFLHSNIIYSNALEMGEVRSGGCGSERQVERHNGDIFSIFCDMKVFFAFSLGSAH